MFIRKILKSTRLKFFFIPVADREMVKFSPSTNTDRFTEWGIPVFARERWETELVCCANKTGRILEFKNKHYNIK